ncbi:hypothetical protein KZX50_00445 [Bacillus infantis]|uniref:hypothetical protein n=1 Tax=Bacillus infantis TaxID=324767 RepID=UPI002005F120|nr:hypothetical protein [Bacillus infantis]MCK6203916.1 hypothetical protein [Bacillus infantis]
MKILIQIDYLGRHSEITQSGDFGVDAREFAIDPDKEAARVAYGFLQWIKKEMTVQKIRKVVYNGEKDITQLVVEMEKAPLD